MPDELNTIPTMPPAIAAGIAIVIGQVRQLGYDEKNNFQGYAYASIDKFLAAMGPLLSAAGLFILSDEESLEIKEGVKAKDGKEIVSAWLHLRWAFTIGHTSGATWGPFHRTVMVPANGAQAFGSAQSYSLKQFMRGLFLIPTGDQDDPDSQDKHPLPKQQPEPRKPAPKPEPAAETLGPKTVAALAKVETLATVKEINEAEKKTDASSIPENSKSLLRAAFGARRVKLCREAPDAITLDDYTNGVVAMLAQHPWYERCMAASAERMAELDLADLAAAKIP